ncbi:MAG: choline/carnitine O-acyltransferase [Candidatus Caldatribacteriota bacterium]|nr:choline/carnitine O-acyltransferase [Candidatus Caldatribacteriota bacterium]
MNMYFYQKSLPKLPLPILDQTCQKLMNWSKIMLSEDEIKLTRDAINNFQSTRGVGPILQNHLRDLSKDPKLNNWLEPFWSESYLCNPSPLPTGGNVTFVLDKNPKIKHLLLPEFLTSLIITLFKFNDLILTESLDIDYQRKQPLCMSQYKTLLSTTRIPGKIKDFHLTEANTSHVIIIHKGHYYRLNVLNNSRKILSYNTLYQNLMAIINTPKTINRLALGDLTALPRRKWAHLRNHLITLNPRNEKSLHQIERALGVFVIDENQYKNDSQMFKNIFCGDSHNRWYDKSLQFILNEAGDFGINYEHSGVDGTTLGHLVAYLYQNLRTFETSSNVIKKTPVDEITFTLDDLLKSAIKEAATLSQETYENFAFEVLPFTDFGKEHIKTLGVSPDSFVQIGIQLAQYKIFQRVFNAYESVMTKQFLGGRTETMRPLTRESLAFVRNPTLEHLRAASLTHVERINECKNGQGIDRHLFGLKKMHENLYPLKPLPKIFSSPGYTAITTDYFSTSTSSSFGMRYAGYGPSVKDGFAVRYLVYKDKLHFVLSCQKHRADFLIFLKASLEKSLKEMATLT